MPEKKIKSMAPSGMREAAAPGCRKIARNCGLFGKLFSAGSRKARQAREDAEIDEVKLALFSRNPHKTHPPITPDNA